MPLINVNTDISSKARCPHFGFSFRLHHTSFIRAVPAHMRLFADVIRTEICVLADISKSQNQSLLPKLDSILNEPHYPLMGQQFTAKTQMRVCAVCNRECN